MEQPIPQDRRNHGLRRVYMYKRLKDGFLFGLDNELQASHLHRRKDFNQKYEYIGWTDHNEYNEELRKIRAEIDTKVGAEIEEKQMDSEKAEEYKYKRVQKLTGEAGGRVNAAIEAVAEKARQNPDKTLPRDFRVKGQAGEPMQNQMIADSLRMMR